MTRIKVDWHHQVGLPIQTENEIRTKVQQDLDQVVGAKKAELLGHFFDLYSPPHAYWTKREQFGEGTGSFTVEQQKYFQERERVFGRKGRVPILGSLVLRSAGLDRLYDMRLCGRGETTFRIWTDWPERISLENKPPLQFTHVNQDVIGHESKLFTVSGSPEEVAPYIERTVGTNDAYHPVKLSESVILYLSHITKDGATSDVLPLFRST